MVLNTGYCSQKLNGLLNFEIMQVSQKPNGLLNFEIGKISISYNHFKVLLILFKNYFENGRNTWLFFNVNLICDSFHANSMLVAEAAGVNITFHQAFFTFLFCSKTLLKIKLCLLFINRDLNSDSVDAKINFVMQKLKELHQYHKPPAFPRFSVNNFFSMTKGVKIIEVNLHFFYFCMSATNNKYWPRVGIIASKSAQYSSIYGSTASRFLLFVWKYHEDWFNN